MRKHERMFHRKKASFFIVLEGAKQCIVLISKVNWLGILWICFRQNSREKSFEKIATQAIIYVIYIKHEQEYFIWNKMWGVAYITSKTIHFIPILSVCLQNKFQYRCCISRENRGKRLVKIHMCFITCKDSSDGFDLLCVLCMNSKFIYRPSAGRKFGKILLPTIIYYPVVLVYSLRVLSSDLLATVISVKESPHSSKACQASNLFIRCLYFVYRPRNMQM